MKYVSIREILTSLPLFLVNYRVYPARMVPRDPLESQDAMVQR